MDIETIDGYLWAVLQKLTPTPVEDGDHMLIPDWLNPEGWWLRFPKYHPVTSPPTNLKKVYQLTTILQSSPLVLSLKPSPESEFRSFELELPVLAWCTEINSYFAADTHCWNVAFCPMGTERWKEGLLLFITSPLSTTPEFLLMKWLLEKPLRIGSTGCQESILVIWELELSASPPEPWGGNRVWRLT